MTASGFYFDPQTLAGLRQHDDQRQTLERVAQQFEALFVHMLLKQMREASFGGGLFDSSQSTFYRDMFDAQMAQHVGGQTGLGIAQLLVNKLAKTLPHVPEAQAAPVTTAAQPAPAVPASPAPATVRASAEANVPRQGSVPEIADVEAGVAPQDIALPTAQWLASAATVSSTESAPPPQPEEALAGSAARDAAADWRSPQEFLAHLEPFARKAAQQLGVASEVLLAQATLETGWGRKLPRHPDGRNSYNLFGIKADARWSGDWVRKPTLEFTQGAMRREHAQFRAYPSAQASFQDYASFLKSSPRYADALAVANDPAAYLHALQNAGYATDPRYADKILALVQSERFRSALPPDAVKESNGDAV